MFYLNLQLSPKKILHTSYQVFLRLLCDPAVDDFSVDGVDPVNVAEDRVEVEIELPAKELP